MDYLEELEALGKDNFEHLRKLGFGALYFYAFALIAVFVVRITSRKSVLPTKPLITVILDTVFEIPSLLKVGPWGRPNTIMKAMEMAMNETKLTDFGHDGEGKRNNSDQLGFVNRYETSQNNGLGKCKGRYSPLGYLLSFNTMQRRMGTSSAC